MVANGTVSSNGHSTDAALLDPHRWLQERHKPSWRDSEAPYTYTVKWHDESGLEQFVCIREDSMDSLLVQVRVLTQMIRQSKAHHASQPPTPQEAHQGTNSSQDDSQHSPQGDNSSVGLPQCRTHGVAMRRRSWGGYSHRLADGSGWCKGEE